MKTICYIDASNLMKTGNGAGGYKVDHKKLFDYLDNRFKPEKIMYFGALFVADFYQTHNFLENDYLDIEEVKAFFKNYKNEHREISFENANNTTKAVLASLKRRSFDVNEVMRQIDFLEKLVESGFELKIKPLKIMPNGKKKADCDVNITVEGMANFNDYDKIILFSGDGDFLPFLRFLSDSSKDVEVYSFKKSTAREIRDYMKGKWVNLGVKDYRDKLELER